jgi:hypothetical protein
MRHARIAPLIALAISAGTACNDNEITGPTAPPPEVDDRTFPTTATTLPDTSPSTETTGSASSGPTTTAEPALPTVSTIVPTVPQPLDPNDPNNRREVPNTPDELAILAAYIDASDRITAYYSKSPSDANDPLIVDGPFTTDRIQREQTTGQQNNEARERLDVSGGITLRPYIVGFSPGDTTAVVFDCQLDATVWRNADTGEVIPPPNDTYPNTGPEVATAIGLSAQLTLVGDRWLFDSATSQAGACL